MLVTIIAAVVGLVIGYVIGVRVASPEFKDET